MSTTRLEAFSDGVIAILITIMILELKVPNDAEIATLRGTGSHFVAYILSFIFLGIYWSNHHHMLQVTERVSGAVLWANLHLLFWLSLVPVATAWVGENPSAPWPTAVYGVILLASSLAYYIMQTIIIRLHGEKSILARAVGRDYKGKLSPALYTAGILISFANTVVADALYVLVALIWLVPDRRIEEKVVEELVEAVDDSSEQR